MLKKMIVILMCCMMITTPVLANSQKINRSVTLTTTTVCERGYVFVVAVTTNRSTNQSSVSIVQVKKYTGQSMKCN